MDDSLTVAGLVVLIVVGFFGGAILIIQGIGLKCDSVPVRVFVDGKDIYHGISACVNVDSSGANTTVKVSSSFMCMFPTAYYVSKDVRIVNE